MRHRPFRKKNTVAIERGSPQTYECPRPCKENSENSLRKTCGVSADDPMSPVVLQNLLQNTGATRAQNIEFLCYTGEAQGFKMGPASGSCTSSVKGRVALTSYSGSPSKLSFAATGLPSPCGVHVSPVLPPLFSFYPRGSSICLGGGGGCHAGGIL